MTRSREGGPPPNPEQQAFLNDLLDAVPVLPVGVVTTASGESILDIIQPPEDDEDIDVYAWHGTRDLVVDVRRTRRDTTGPVIGLEICSSTPIASAHSTAREFDHCRVKARGIGQAFMTTEGIEQLRDADKRLVPLAQSLARDEDSRALMIAAIQRTLFELTPDQLGDVIELRKRLSYNLATQQFAYEKVTAPSEQDEDGIEAGWGLRYAYRDAGRNYLEMLSCLKVPSGWAKYAQEGIKSGQKTNFEALREIARTTDSVGEELALGYIAWQADVIARLVANNPDFRVSRFLSMDMLPPDTIASHSVANMPSSTKSMHLFSHAIASLFNPKRHIQGDIRDELPVPDNSLTFIVSFDGWRPFSNSESTNIAELRRQADEAVLVLEALYKKLKPGGQLVIFPWAESKTSWKERRVLDELKGELGRRINHGVDARTFHKDTVDAWMTVGDRALAETTSMLGGRGSQTFEALIVTKLARNMVERPARNADRARKAGEAAGKLAASQARNQD